MKNKLVVFITALVMVFACALGLVACGDSFEDGTYVLYELIEEDGEKVAIPVETVKFKNGVVTLADSEEHEGVQPGSYKYDDGKLTVTMDGDPLVFKQKKGMWQATDDYGTYALVKKGSKPEGYEVVLEYFGS